MNLTATNIKKALTDIEQIKGKNMRKLLFVVCAAITCSLCAETNEPLKRFQICGAERQWKTAES